ncbi:MAG: hypothetical protein DWQ04_17220, partial [Chloroflexi bacterium]
MRKFLFTTLLSNDLGLLTRSLPIARELAKKGHQIIFCSPGKAPSKLIANAGFENILPKHPIYYLMSIDLSSSTFFKLIQSKQFKESFGNLFVFLWHLIRSIPYKRPPSTSEIWNMDHALAMMGMQNKNFVRSICDSLMEL